MLATEKLTEAGMKAEIIYYSATGTTRKIVKAFSEGLNCFVRFADITKPANREKAVTVTGDLVVIAMPVYGERIPGFIYDYLKRIDGKDKLLVVISVYGNMGFGISTAQFSRFASENKFKLIGAGMFIGEHTYANEKSNVALGRPDEDDLKSAREFGASIRAKCDRGEPEQIKVHESVLAKFISEFPDSGVRFLIKQPVEDRKQCNHCGLCATMCPVGAINPVTLEIDERKCLRCFSCVKNCPKKARRAEFRMKLFKVLFERMGSKRKENRIVI